MMTRPSARTVFVLYLICVLAAAACSAQSAPTDLPTQPIIPSTPTNTPTPITPTLTPPDLPGPLDVVTVTSTAPELTPPDDPVAADLVVLARRRIAQELDLPERSVHLVEVTPFVWTESSLGCPQPGQKYVPVEVDGYRLVLSVGDKQYIFHSDSERLSPCDAKYEHLPQEATPEATSQH